MPRLSGGCGNSSRQGGWHASSPVAVLVDITDDGIGVFRRVRESLQLADDVEAVFVLEKGSFTTQPARHTGEGIFFIESGQPVSARIRARRLDH